MRHCEEKSPRVAVAEMQLAKRSPLAAKAAPPVTTEEGTHLAAQAAALL